MMDTSSKKANADECGLKPGPGASFRTGSSGAWWTLFGIIVLASLATRLYKLDQPAAVCWDETHWGKYSGAYIRRTFYFDVNPPLGIMLIGLFGYLDGYNATFSFEKPGVPYLDHPYLGMRLGCAIMGALVVPLCFLIIWEMTFSLPASTFSASLILFDTGMATLSRYLLLDPGLMFFMVLSIYATVKFQNLRHRSFSAVWWFWLITIGFALAGTITTKYVGAFTVLLVGLRAITDLWIILGDMSRPVSYTVKHFMARALGLILVPVVLYVSVFYVHLILLNRSGMSSKAVSPAFQIDFLDGFFGSNDTMPRDVAYGSKLRFINDVINGDKLHSHPHNYPEGASSQQQQVTTMGEYESKFTVKKYKQPINYNDPPQLVRHGDLIQLVHDGTGLSLHSHSFPSPITQSEYQVTANGYADSDDVNNLWRVMIEDGEKGQVWQALNQRFQLVHYVRNCVLSTTGQQLPRWGYYQNEVVCQKNHREPLSFWLIETNAHPTVPKESIQNFKLSFIQRFIHLHKRMPELSGSIKPKENERTSRPWMWPISLQGLHFSSLNSHRVYLLGNPVIWWGNIVFMIIYLLLELVNSVQVKRHVVFSPKQLALRERTLNSCRWLFIGWLLHYVPFWFMYRVLYYHHYFPAAIISSILSGVIIDYLVESIVMIQPASRRNSFYNISLILFAFTVIYSFYLFAPTTYGYQTYGNVRTAAIARLKWLPTWEI